MRGVGMLVVLSCGLLVAGCGADPSPPPTTTDAVAPTQTPTQSRPRCLEPSASTLATVAGTLTEARISLDGAAARLDPASGLWLLAASLDGAPGTEQPIGIWATSTDPTEATFDGEVYAVDAGASQWSGAPSTDAVDIDPESVPVLGCLARA